MKNDSSLDRLDAFEAYRDRMNRRILEKKDHLGPKRFFRLDDAMNVALVVGGSIVIPHLWIPHLWIPHLRRAVETIDLLRQRAASRRRGGSATVDRRRRTADFWSAVARD